MDQELKELLLCMQNDIRNINKRTERIEEDVQALKSDNAKLVTLEKKVDLLLEGQQGINEKFPKLDTVADDVEEIKVKVTALENITKDNTSQIRELRIAK